MRTLVVVKIFFVSFFFLGCTSAFDLSGDKVPAEMIQLESKADGSGSPVSETVQINLSEELNLYAVYRDQQGQYVKNVEVSWRLVGSVGSLTILSNGTSASYSSISPGTVTVEVLYQDKVIKTMNIETLPTPQPSLTWSIINNEGSVNEGDNFEIIFNISKIYDKNVSFEVSTSNQTAIAGSDYVGKSSELVTILAGQTQTTLNIATITDNLYENLDESFIVSVSNLQNAITSLSSADISVVDMDSPPTASVADVVVSEDAGSAEVTVSLSHASYQTITLDYATSDDVAVSSGSYVDFTDATGSLSFLPGETSKTISIIINDDSLNEVDETYNLVLSNPVNLSSITDSSAEITITDNDLEPTVSIADASVNEASSTVSLSVSLSAMSGRQTSVEWKTNNNGAVAGQDYTGVGLQTLTIPAYTSSVNVSVSILDDSDFCEANDDFEVEISNPSGLTLSDAVANVNIVDNDIPEIVITDAPSVSEGTKATYTASLSQACALDVSFEYKTYPLDAKEGFDYNYTSGIANLPSSSPTANIEVQTVDNSLYEGNQRFLLVAINNSNLVNAKTSNTSIAVTKIIDNDTGLPEPHVADFSLSSETHSACAVMGDGDVKCWGKKQGVHHFGDFNVGDEVSEMGDNLQASFFGSVAGDGVTPYTAKKMALGENHSCVIQDNNAIKCWGDNYGAKLGVGVYGWQNWGDKIGEIGENFKTLDLTGSSDIPLDIQAGEYQSCATFYPSAGSPSNAFVKCWGRSYYTAQGDIGTNYETGDSATEVRDLPAIDFGVTAGVYVDQISVGARHACALLTNGEVYCWGEDTYGQAGTNSSNLKGDNDTEVGVGFQKAILNGDLATQVSAGSSYTCAVLANGRAKCWGWGNEGELGDGDKAWTHRIGDEAGEMEALGYINLGTTDGTTPRSVKLIKAGSRHTCVILADNDQIKCFGENSSGQLGVGSTDDKVWNSDLGDNLPEVDLGSTYSAKDLYLGEFFTCALLNTDEVKCWGNNSKGQLGYGNTNNIGDEPNEIASTPTVDVGTGRTVKAFAKGFSQESVCVILDNDEVKCWGNNKTNSFARNDIAFADEPGEMGASLPSLNIASGVKARQITLGEINCIISTGDEVYCWGSQYEGALGNGVSDRDVTIGDYIYNLGNFPKSLTPTGLKPLQLVSAGRTVCVLYDDFTVRCWGDGGDGKLGVGVATSANFEYSSQLGDNLQAIDFGTKLYPVRLTASSNGFCAVLSDQSVKCWGSNFSGKLGIGSSVSQLGDNLSDMGDAWSSVDFGSSGFTSGVSKVKNVVAARDSYCALFENQKIKCWGDNSQGQLGYEDKTSRGGSSDDMGDNLDFVNLGTGVLIKNIFGTVMDDRFCALTTTGEVKCWGDDGNIGLLGLGYGTSPKGDGASEMGDNLSPALTGSTNVQSVYSNYTVTCALYVNGQMKCWTGSNYWGIAGQGHDNSVQSSSEIGDNMSFIDLE